MKLKNYKIEEVYQNSGTSQKTGEPWTSTEVLVSNNDEMYESRLLVRLMPKCAESFSFKKGDVVDLEVLHSTHEFNGRFFNQINAWKVMKEA